MLTKLTNQLQFPFSETLNKNLALLTKNIKIDLCFWEIFNVWLLPNAFWYFHLSVFDIFDKYRFQNMLGNIKFWIGTLCCAVQCKFVRASNKGKYQWEKMDETDRKNSCLASLLYQLTRKDFFLLTGDLLFKCLGSYMLGAFRFGICQSLTSRERNGELKKNLLK